MTAPVDEIITPIDRYLAEQRDSTAVERFSRRHDAALLEEHELLPGERWYADRLPATAPGDGQQYAFRVDLDRCTGCKACVSACHSLNGLDEGESWRSVGQLVDPTGVAPTQTVPSGCHHCVDPACLSGCPTNAYEKDPITGIVTHLDDQCFGCGYCTLTCPYEVPKMNHRLGVVRKCDLCADRLADGEAPACVQGCPTSAITISVVDTDDVVARSSEGRLVPGAPESSITAPTTEYVSRRMLGDAARAADHHALHPSSSHPPLAFMLVLTQLSVGVLVAGLVAGTRGTGMASSAAVAAAVSGVVAIAGSVSHLGRPIVAWRAVLGVGHSWLSREIVAFGAYGGLVSTYAVGAVAGVDHPALEVLGVLAAVVGAGGVLCSALIYVATRRTWWAPRFAVSKFVGTSAVTGSLLLAALGVATTAMALVGAAALVVSMSVQGALLRDRWTSDSDLDRTRRLLLGPLATSTRWRFGLAATAVFLAVIAGASGSLGVAGVAALAAVAGEFVERYQFFVASVAPRMPGGFRR